MKHVIKIIVIYFLNRFSLALSVSVMCVSREFRCSFLVLRLFLRLNRTVGLYVSFFFWVFWCAPISPVASFDL